MGGKLGPRREYGHLAEGLPFSLTMGASQDCLYGQGYRDNFEDNAQQLKSTQGKRLLEAGCGTALPTLYLLELLFRQVLQENTTENTDRIPREKTVVHLQDYNAEGQADIFIQCGALADGLPCSPAIHHLLQCAPCILACQAVFWRLHRYRSRSIGSGQCRLEGTNSERKEAISHAAAHTSIPGS